MKLLHLFLFAGLIMSVSLLAGCAKSATKFTVLGFEMNIEDEPVEPSSEDV